MWYRADRDQENYIGTGTSLSTKVSRDKRRFLCKAENEIGVGRSNLTHLDVLCMYHTIKIFKSLSIT